MSTSLEKSRRESILLITPASYIWWTVPFLGIASIAAVLEKAGINVGIIDCQVTRNYKKKIAECIKDYSAVGLVTTIGNISSVIDIVTQIREYSSQIKIILGGPHATAVYEKLIPRYADIVVLGEGEDTIVESIRNNDLSGVRGIAYWRDGSVEVNPGRPLIEDLDRLPFPAWHLYDLKSYRFADARIPLASLSTSRGCPYQCIYCTRFVHGNQVRLRSLESVLGEIDYLVDRFKVKEINIIDNNFTYYPERVKQFCNMVIQKGYRNLRFNLHSAIRADICDADMFRALAKARFNWVGINLNTALSIDGIRAAEKADLEKTKEMLRVFNRLSIKVRLDFIVGLPYNTPETMREAISTVKSLFMANPSIRAVSIHMAIPLPGTEFYKIVEEKGRFLRNLTTTSITYFEKAVYETDRLRASDLNFMYTKAHRELLRNPVYLWRILRLSPSIFRVFPKALKYFWDKLFREGYVN
jgi:anaerobic magnesium-protoporphyrin IX monomethyl ester cyclase